MNYKAAEELFRKKFPGGQIRCTDFGRHFGGYLVNVALTLDESTTPDNDLVRAWLLFGQLVIWLRDNREQFGTTDRFGVVTGWPLSFGKTGPNPKRSVWQIYKGWLPYDTLLRLNEPISPSKFKEDRGTVHEMPGWANGIY